MESIVSQIVPLLSGPASAVIVLLIVFGATYYIFAKQILPMFEKLLNKRDAELDKLMSEHRLDRDAWLLSIQRISDGIDTLNVSQGVLKQQMDDVASDIVILRKDIAQVLYKSAADIV